MPILLLRRDGDPPGRAVELRPDTLVDLVELAAGNLVKLEFLPGAGADAYLFGLLLRPGEAREGGRLESFECAAGSVLVRDAGGGLRVLEKAHLLADGFTFHDPEEA
jgi:hypothetical protein